MRETYYRIHWAQCPPMSADHAWSYLGAGPLAGDLSRYECPACDGNGTDRFSEDGSCGSCGGEGSREADRGYSAVTTPADLLDCARQFGAEPGEGDRVITFEGDLAGWGVDGEPLVIPSRIISQVTWDQFTASLV